MRAWNKVRKRKILRKKLPLFITSNLQHENNIHSTLKYTLDAYVKIIFCKKNWAEYKR